MKSSGHRSLVITYRSL